MKRAVPAERGLPGDCDTRKGKKGGIYLGADPKVTELHLAPGVHQHIGWLHICLGEKKGIIHIILGNTNTIYTEIQDGREPQQNPAPKSSNIPTGSIGMVAFDRRCYKYLLQMQWFVSQQHS